MLQRITFDAMFWFQAAGVVLGFIVYVLIFRVNRVAAYVILGLFVAGILYHTADWEYWDTYFKIPWDMGRYTR